MTGVLEVFHRRQRVGTLREQESGGMVLAYGGRGQLGQVAAPISLPDVLKA